MIDEKKKLIKKIHVIKKEIGLDDETYREILKELFNANSSTELDIFALNKLVEFLESKKTKDFEKYKNRDIYFATDKQLRYIAALFAEKSFIKDKEKRYIALNRFIKRIVKVDNILFLHKKDVEKIINAIKNMKQRG